MLGGDLVFAIVPVVQEIIRMGIPTAASKLIRLSCRYACRRYRDIVSVFPGSGGNHLEYCYGVDCLDRQPRTLIAVGL